jgi:hypothetical protein
MPAYLLPSLIEARLAGHLAPLLTLAVAAWFRCLRGTDLAGSPIEIADSRRDHLVRLSRAGHTDPAPLLGVREVVGPLGDDLWVRRELSRGLRDIERLGARAALHLRLGPRPRDGEKSSAPRTLKPAPSRDPAPDRYHPRGGQLRGCDDVVVRRGRHPFRLLGSRLYRICPGDRQLPL